MKSRRQYITEPGERRWLQVTPLAAAVGGLVVVLLLGAIIISSPGDRSNLPVDRPAISSAPAQSLPPAASYAPAYTLPPIADDAESYASPDRQSPTF